MKQRRGLTAIIVGMLALSAGLYYVEFLMSHEWEPIVSTILREFAFLPIHAIVVVVVFEGILAAREKAAMRHKLNMVIGAFFSEMGQDLVRALAAFDIELEEFSPHVVFHTDWTAKEFAAARDYIETRHHPLRVDEADLAKLMTFLHRNRPFMLGLLENSNLLEYEAFSELLWALTHLQEELDARGSFGELPSTDLTHLQGDISRVYGRMIIEWLQYVEHLKSDYPYLYSFTIRTNPFDPNAEIVVAG